MVGMFDHRAASILFNPSNRVRRNQPEPLTAEQHNDPNFAAILDSIRQSVRLTCFAVFTRYPVLPRLQVMRNIAALGIAETVVCWVEEQVWCQGKGRQQPVGTTPALTSLSKRPCRGQNSEYSHTLSRKT